MSSVSEEQLQGFHKLAVKQGIKFESEEAERQSASALIDLAEILLEQAEIEFKRKRRLKDEPEGFKLDGDQHRCRICDDVGYWHVSKTYWYTKWGVILCDECYLLRNRIPKVVFKGKREEDWCCAADIFSQYDLRASTVNRMVREGKLKARDVVGENAHKLRLFLKKDNPDIADILQREVRIMQSKKR